MKIFIFPNSLRVLSQYWLTFGSSLICNALTNLLWYFITYLLLCGRLNKAYWTKEFVFQWKREGNSQILCRNIEYIRPAFLLIFLGTLETPNNFTRNFWQGKSEYIITAKELHIASSAFFKYLTILL